MLLFWGLVALLLATAIGSVLLPLWRHGDDRQYTEIEDASLAIYEQRLKELAIDQDIGTLSSDKAEDARTELERELIREHADGLSDQTPTNATSGLSRTSWTVLLALLMPVIALGLYSQLGAPQLITTTASMAVSQIPHDVDMKTLDAMITRLKQHIVEQPDDLKGWLLLGRTFMKLERYTEAAQALKQANALKADDPEILLSYADALAMAQGGKVSGKPAIYIHKALQLAPDDPTSLWLAGMAAAEQDDFKTALQHWQRLEPMLADDNQRAKLQQMITHAQQRMGTGSRSPAVGSDTAAPTATPVAIKVQVRMDDGIAKDTDPDTTLFIYARAVSGPPMPLAIVRKQVRDLPLSVTLTDAMAMSPVMRLSKFQRVRITARISQSGTAAPQSGDLFGEVSDIAVNSRDPVAITIQQRIP